MLAAAVLGFALGLVTPPQALIAQPAGSITLLDARSRGEYRNGHIPGAVRIDWSDYRDGWGRTGKLPTDLGRLAERLAELGIDDRRPVVVYGDANDGWGEEGRVVWMLAYLRHPDVALLDGGWKGWLEAKGAVSTLAEEPRPGRFTARPDPALRASGDDVEAARHGAGVVLDVRSEREWLGATPHFEARGGHIPGAIHLEWKELLDRRGRIDPDRARALLRGAGVDPARPVITYCTAGVRAAEAWVILRALGYADVRVYDGSWFEWSADDHRPVSRD